MDVDFLAFCCLSIIILTNKNKYISIFSCILFGLFIFFIRDINGAPDAEIYIEYFTSDKDAIGYGFSRTYSIFKYFLVNILNFPGIFAYQITALIPLLTISLISIREKYIFPIFFFVASEAFPILSFNAMRQGLGISIFIYSCYFIQNFLEKKQSFSKIYYLIFALLLIFAGTIHSTVFGLIILLIGFFTSLRFLKILPKIFNKYVIERKFIFIFLLSLISISTFIFLITIIKIPYIALAFEYLQRKDTYNSGVIGSFYRIFVMLILFIYPNFKKNNFNLLLTLKEYNKNDLSFYTFLSILSLSFLAPITTSLFNRFSYFYIVPIIFNSLKINKYKRFLLENSTLTNLFLIFIGLITYGSNAINIILYKQ